MLQAQGSAPSIQRVRELLGTGSNSTIADHLKRWQRELTATPALALPPGAPESVLEALQTFWHIALTQAQTHFDSEREQAAAEVAAAQAARQQALVEQQQAEAERDAEQAHNQQLQQQLRQLQDTLLLEQERHNAAVAALAAAEQQLQAARADNQQTRQHYQERKQRLQQQLEQQLAQHRHDHTQALAHAEQRLQAERERGEASEARLLTLLDRHRCEFAQARQGFDDARASWQTEQAALAAELGKTRHTLIEARTQLAAEQQRAIQLATELMDQKQTQQIFQTRYLDAIKTIENLRGALALAQAEQQHLQQALASCQAALSAARPPAAPSHDEEES